MQSDSPLVTRVVTSSRIVHNDLQLGRGTVEQYRGNSIRTEQSIELMFIFRTVDEIQHLDTARYARVGLHQEGPLREYWYNETSEAVPNNNTVLKPYTVTRAGRWLLVEHVDHEARKLIKELQDAINT